MEPAFCMQPISDDSTFEYLFHQHGEKSTAHLHILGLFNFIMHSASVCKWKLWPYETQWRTLSLPLLQYLVSGAGSLDLTLREEGSAYDIVQFVQ